MNLFLLSMVSERRLFLWPLGAKSGKRGGWRIIVIPVWWLSFCLIENLLQFQPKFSHFDKHLEHQNILHSTLELNGMLENWKDLVARQVMTNEVLPTVSNSDAPSPRHSKCSIIFWADLVSFRKKKICLLCMDFFKRLLWFHQQIIFCRLTLCDFPYAYFFLSHPFNINRNVAFSGTEYISRNYTYQEGK